MIHLGTIGPLSVRIGDKPIPATNQKVIAALLYLTVERGKPVARRKLGDLLFSEVADDASSHSVRQLVYRMRRLGADVDGDAVSVTVKTASATWDIERCIERGFATPEELQALRRGYLSDYRPDESDAFVRWLEEHRDHVVRKLRTVLLRQLQSDRSRRSYGTIEGIARACLALDPLNEEATLAVAEGLAMGGAKAEALRFLDDYLEEVGPRSAQLTLSPRILRERISAYITTPDREVGSLIGRDEELGILMATLDESARGSARACIVTGPSGIGKTRLLNEACSRSALAGTVVVRASFRPHDVARPFAILRDLGSALLDLPGSLGASPKALAGLRGLSGKGPSQYTNVPADTLDTQAIVAAVEADVIEVIDAIAEEQPLALVADNAHWADGASLDLLSAILGDKRRVCVLLSSQRPLELTRGLSRNPIVTQIALGSLAPRDSTSVLAERFSAVRRPIDHTFVDSAIRTSGGIPFYLHLLFQNFVVTGDVTAIPPSLAESVTARINHLSEPARGVFDAIAILGNECTERRLSEITEMPTYAFVNSLRALEGTGLIKANGDRVAVSHDLFLAAAHRLMPTSVARVLHRSAAELLERESSRIEPLAIANHWEGCGEFELAVTALIKGAEESTRLGRPREAMEALVQAHHLAQSEERKRSVDRALLLACRAAGECRKGVEVAERIGVFSGNGSPLERLAAFEVIAAAGNIVAGHAELLEVIAADRTLDPDVRAEAAWQLLDRAEDVGSREIGERAIQAIGDLDERLLSVQHTRMIYETAYGDPASAIRIAHALSQSVKVVPVGRKIKYLTSAVIAFYRCGDIECAATLCEEAYEIAKATKVWAACVNLSSVLADVYWEAGNTTLANKWYLVACAQIVATGGRDMGFHLRGIGIMIALDAGDPSRARELLTEAECLFPRVTVDRMGLDRLAYSVRIDLASGTEVDIDRVESLLAGHLKRRADGLHDLVADTLFSALCRAGRASEAAQLRDQYLLVRKDRFPVPVRLTFLRPLHHRLNCDGMLSAERLGGIAASADQGESR